jgi:hypothetical protein
VSFFQNPAGFGKASGEDRAAIVPQASFWYYDDTLAFEPVPKPGGRGFSIRGKLVFEKNVLVL